MTSDKTTSYAKVVQRKIVHSGNPLLTLQVPKTTRKNVGEGFRTARMPRTEIDAVMATSGVYFAEITRELGSQLSREGESRPACGALGRVLQGAGGRLPAEEPSLIQ